jgi:hypothetical protein
MLRLRPPGSRTHPGGPPAGRRRRAVLVAVLLGGLVSPVAACGRDCTGTALRVSPVRAHRGDDPLTIGARLSRDGKPFPGARVKLAVTLVGQSNARAEALFYATTDAEGLASVTRPEGVAGLSVPGQQVTGYGAYYQPMNKVDGTRYCWSSAAAPITCDSGGGPGPCPRGPLVPTPSATG